MNSVDLVAGARGERRAVSNSGGGEYGGERKEAEEDVQ